MAKGIKKAPLRVPLELKISLNQITRGSSSIERRRCWWNWPSKNAIPKRSRIERCHQTSGHCRFFGAFHFWSTQVLLDLGRQLFPTRG